MGETQVIVKVNFSQSEFWVKNSLLAPFGFVYASVKTRHNYLKKKKVAHV